MKKIRDKFNIIDIIIIILVFMVVIFLVVKYFNSNNDALSKKDVIISFCSDYVSDYVIDKTKIGDSVMDDESEIMLGKVTDIVTSESLTYFVSDEHNKVMFGSREGFSSVKMQVKHHAIESEFGAIIDGRLFSVGHGVVIHAGMGVYDFLICDIEFSK